ncbi:hypothetical protein EDB80DRAFT_290712 [Ilyonectria destructans]|nr:hypothetical protein EDB80DRAFT_290712 [Ilyonectria destructans]
MDAAARRHTQGWSREMMSYVALQPIARGPPSIALSCAPLVPSPWRRLMISSIGPVVFVFAFAFVLQRFISLPGIRILCLLTLLLFDLVSSDHPIQALAFEISSRQTIRPLPAVVDGLVALALGGCFGCNRVRNPNTNTNTVTPSTVVLRVLRSVIHRTAQPQPSTVYPTPRSNSVRRRIKPGQCISVAPPAHTRIHSQVVLVKAPLATHSFTCALLISHKPPQSTPSLTRPRLLLQFHPRRPGRRLDLSLGRWRPPPRPHRAALSALKLPGLSVWCDAIARAVPT